MTNISDYWKEIDVEFYLNYVAHISKLDKDNPDYLYHRLAYLESKPYTTIKALPVLQLAILIERWDFLYEEILEIPKEELEPFIFLDGKYYYIEKNFDNLSFEQWQNKDSVMQLSKDDNNYLKNIPMMLGIVAQRREEYTYDKAVELSKVILQEKMYYVIPSIGFFLTNEELSPNDMILYLKKIQQEEIMKAEAMLNNLLNLRRHGVGMSFLKRWQITIYVSMMRYYLRRFKKFLQI
jgi:hypothetical protein